jgi:maltooligosyltrehalose synthase
MGLAEDWADTAIELPAGRWKNHLTDEPLLGATVPLSELLHNFPIALLTKEEK